MGETISKQKTAYILLFFVVLLWGLNWPIMKIGLNSIGPLTFAALRMILAFIIMFSFAVITNHLRWPSRPDWRVVFSIGVFHMGLHVLFMSYGLQFVEASRSAILAYTTPIWVVPLAVLFLKEKLSIFMIAGALIGLSGIMTLFNPFTFDWTNVEFVIGNVSLLLSALAWAISILLVKKLYKKKTANPIDLAPWYFLTGAVVITPVALIFESSQTIIWSWELVSILIYNGFVATAFCFIAVVTINRYLPAVVTSIGMLGVPVGGVIASAIILGEAIDLLKSLSLFLLICGLMLILPWDEIRLKFKKERDYKGEEGMMK